MVEVATLRQLHWGLGRPNHTALHTARINRINKNKFKKSKINFLKYFWAKLTHSTGPKNKILWSKLLRNQNPIIKKPFLLCILRPDTFQASSGKPNLLIWHSFMPILTARIGPNTLHYAALIQCLILHQEVAGHSNKNPQNYNTIIFITVTIIQW